MSFGKTSNFILARDSNNCAIVAFYKHSVISNISKNYFKIVLVIDFNSRGLFDDKIASNQGAINGYLAKYSPSRSIHEEPTSSSRAIIDYHYLRLRLRLRGDLWQFSIPYIRGLLKLAI